MGMLIKKMVRMAVALVTKLIFIAVGVVICMPVFLVLTGSVMGDSDLQECLAPVFELGQGFVTWRLIPQYPTVDHYIRLLFQSPQFFILFWFYFGGHRDGSFVFGSVALICRDG